MHSLYSFLFLFLHAPVLLSQPLHLPDGRDMATASGRTTAETAVGVGRSFLGKPYVPHTLDESRTEQLVVNLAQFDCTTFVETISALSLAWHELPDRKNHEQLESLFRKYLTRVRYRNGQIDGYASRLHYFSEWLRDNERKGLLQDVTPLLAGNVTVSKPISYMTSKVYRYPALTDPMVFKQIAQVETNLSQQAFAFVPKKNLRKAEANLRDGDIVMLTASRPGLDMKHCGFAVWQNGRVHLLHASSDHGRVVITSQTLTDYVMANRWLSGIRVARFKTGSNVLTATAK
jgi:hypothetical protein